MANFGQLILTTQGIQAQYEAQGGSPLKFTRIAMGSGNFSGNTMTLTKLVAENVSVPIKNGYVQSKNNAYIVEGFFTNEGLQIGFEWREIGLFIEGEDGSEILYCYANAGNTYDFIPATEDERYAKNVRIATSIGNAQNVSFANSEGFMYVDLVTFNNTVEEFNNTIGDMWSSISTAITYGTNRIEIDSGDDLNDILKCGCYKCVSMESAETLHNCPTIMPFTMDVVPGTGEDTGIDGVTQRQHIIQLLRTMEGEEYFRRISSRPDYSDIWYSGWNKAIHQGDVVNNLTSTDTNKPLSAAQGKALNDKMGDLNYLAPGDVVNNDTSTATNLPWSANRGKLAVERIAALETSFPAGCSKIAAAVTTAMGITTASNASPDTIAANINKILIALMNGYSTISGVSKVSGYTEASVTQNSDKSITISSPTNQGAEVIGCITNAFNLSNYKYAHIVLEQTTSSNYGEIKIGFSTGKNTSYKVSQTFSNLEPNGATKEYGCTLNISSLSGNHYLCFNIPQHGYSSSVKIKMIMLQK